MAMYLESISQEAIADTEMMLTTVAIAGVESQCILVRLIIDALGKPGFESDFQMMGSGENWQIVWSIPELTLEDAKTVIENAIAPRKVLK